MMPGRGSWSDNALIKQLVRENGALSVGMYWDSSAYSESTTRPARSRRRTTSSTPGARTTALTSSAGDDDYPASDFDGAYRSAAGPRCVPRAQQLGARLGRRGLLLGVLLRQVVRARPGPRRLRRGHLLRRRREHGQLRRHLPVRRPRRDRPLGLRRPRRLGRDPVHRHGDAGRLRGGLLHSVVVHPVPGLGGPDASRRSPSAPTASGSSPATARCRSRSPCRSPRAGGSSWRSGCTRPATTTRWRWNVPLAAGCAARRRRAVRAS